MTAAVKDELARLSVTRPCCRRAEVAATLRFANALHLVDTGAPGSSAGRAQLVVEAELDTGASARRLRKEVAEVYGHAPTCTCWRPAGCARATATWCAWRRTAPGSPARSAWSTAPAARCAGCRRRWSAAGPATPPPPGAGRSWPTAR